MVVSEKIIKNRPIKNVITFIFEYLESSFDKIINRRGINDNIKIQKGIINLLYNSLKILFEFLIEQFTILGLILFFFVEIKKFAHLTKLKDESS